MQRNWKCNRDIITPVISKWKLFKWFFYSLMKWQISSLLDTILYESISLLTSRLRKTFFIFFFSKNYFSHLERWLAMDAWIMITPLQRNNKISRWGERLLLDEYKKILEKHYCTQNNLMRDMKEKKKKRQNFRTRNDEKERKTSKFQITFW